MLDVKFIEELKNKNEIVDVISAYCQLERKGGAYWARCPLPGHMEKTPSFCVNQAGQFFKCFGCQRGGDVIKFIMEVESLSYVEAVKFLAARAGMEVPTLSQKDEAQLEKSAKERANRLAILKATARFYVDNLSKAAGEPYLRYIESRGFDHSTIRAFGLGCSTDYNSLPKFLAEKGFAYEDMVAAGVVSYNKDTQTYSDFEAKRFVTPIIDSFNNVLAFGGRVIEKTDFAKYKNTRETSIFVKNRTLFNINNIKKLKREKGELSYIIMVEGYMDVIALHAAGIKNAVASMGTSLTVEQARLLQRYTNTVVISYDGDAAGQKATFRGMEILKDAGLEVKVIALPDKLDPDEYIKAKGAESYLNLINGALPLIDYKLEYLKTVYDLNDNGEKRKYLNAALRVIGESPNEFEREELLKRLSRDSNITYESLKRDLDKNPSKPTTSSIGKQNAAAADEGREETSALVSAERFILSSLISGKKYANVDDIMDFEFSSQIRKDVAEFIIEKLSSSDNFDPTWLANHFEEPYYDEINAVLTQCDAVYCPSEALYAQYYRDCLKNVEISAVEADLKYLEDCCDTEEDLTKKLQLIKIIDKKTKRLHVLKTEDKI